MCPKCNHECPYEREAEEKDTEKNVTAAAGCCAAGFEHGGTGHSHGTCGMH